MPTHARSCVSTLAEWRDRCIESSGLPLNACSYFQYEEYPTFMTCFYSLMYVLQGLLVMIRGVMLFKSLFGLITCIGASLKQDQGVEGTITPWGCEKNSTCSQVTVFKRILQIFMQSFVSLSTCIYVTLAFQEGFGLFNSQGSGSVYFGSLLNYYPLAE